MSWEVLLILILLVLLLLTLTLLLPLLLMKSQNKSQKLLLSLNQNLREQNQDLLNRLMSRDPQTYSVMTALTTSSTTSSTEEYVSPSDSAEYVRYVEAQGLGEVIEPNDDLTGMMLSDLGLEVGDDQFRRA